MKKLIIAGIMSLMGFGASAGTIKIVITTEVYGGVKKKERIGEVIKIICDDKHAEICYFTQTEYTITTDVPVRDPQPGDNIKVYLAGQNENAFEVELEGKWVSTTENNTESGTEHQIEVASE